MTFGSADVIPTTKFQGRILGVELLTDTAAGELVVAAASADLSIPVARGVLS